MHAEIAVAPADDVEVRLVTLHNETDRPRSIAVTTAGRLLLDARQAPAHPRVLQHVVYSERLAELDALLFARRPRSPGEETPCSSTAWSTREPR
jgi:cyclic beta-1,2-glucan synthetase